jgi:hypothetical protein
MQLHKFAFW